MICQALLLNDRNPSPEKIETWLSSNICRCTGYKEIEKAIYSVIELLNIKNQTNQ
jgi:carbon-monoxide dehydrogenase small subunit